jgi:hypothetical protein
MITEIGKNILGKYLIGTAPAYASYIAVGCGAVPLRPIAILSDQDKAAYQAKEALDFEMFRIPITSRGFIEEDGQTKLVFSAEIPTTNRYEITEIGIFSGASNPSALGYDSRTLYAFTREEAWKEDEELIYTQDSPLDNGDPLNYIHPSYLSKGVIQTNATNKLFSTLERQKRFEQARYLNNMIMLSSNFSDLSGTTVFDSTITGKNKISLSTALDLSQNSPGDLLKLALSVVTVSGDSGASAPAAARVVAEFTTFDNSGSIRFNFETAPNLTSTSQYAVVSATLGSGAVSGNFLWSKVNNVNFYASAVDAFGNVVIDEEDRPLHYVSLDALRLENTRSVNPVYGLTAYTVIKNEENGQARPIVKLSNTSSMVEFRLGVGVFNG